MDYPNHTTTLHKHLNFEEHMTIQLRLKDGYSPYKIVKELGRASNTICNEISRDTVTQIIQGHKVDLYLADAWEISTFNIVSIAVLNTNAYVVITLYPTSV